MGDLRNRLLAKKRKPAKQVRFEFDGGTIDADVVKPTLGDRVKALDRAQRDGLVDKDGQPSSVLAGLQFVARLIAQFVYVDGAPIFDESDVDSITEAPWFEDVSAVVQSVFSPDPSAVSGESEATQSPG